MALCVPLHAADGHFAEPAPAHDSDQVVVDEELIAEIIAELLAQLYTLLLAQRSALSVDDDPGTENLLKLGAAS